jgi:ribosome-binding protein aMBF1 (putative translation factor)
VIVDPNHGPSCGTALCGLISDVGVSVRRLQVTDCVGARSGEPHFRELEPAREMAASGRQNATSSVIARGGSGVASDYTTSGIIASIARTVETLNKTVDAELAELPADMRARLVRISELIESVHQEVREDAHERDRSGAAESQGSEAVTKISDLHRRWRKDADYKNAYDALGEEFDLARALIEARTAAGLSQAQLARRMKTSQSYIARIEGGRVRPSTDALERFAQATRTRLRIVFEPNAAH